MPGTIWTSSQPSRPEVVEDLLGRVHQHRCGHVLPFGHAPTVSVSASARVRASIPAGAACRATEKYARRVALSTQLHVVTGKGGTGKTTVAAALAMSLAGEGKKVLLCEVEGRQGIAQLFDVPPLPYEERKIAVGLGGGEVYALAIDPESALLEYLAMYYRLGRAGKALDRFGIIDFATTIAPGVRDVLLTGKVYEAARRREGATSRTTRSSWTPRRPDASPDSSTSTPRSRGSPRSVRSAVRPTRSCR